MANRKDQVVISIIIATYNSSLTLKKVLDSIRSQSFPSNKLQILIVDGGSMDNSLDIAKKYNCKIINNTKTEPVNAKFLGYIYAKSKYIIYLDHDEVLENRRSLEIKYNTLKKNNNIKSVIGSGYKNPPDYPFINRYINEFGDPFSFFIYKLSKDSRFFLNEMKRRYEILEDNVEFSLFNLENNSNMPLIELCAAASMIDAEYMKKHFPETLKKSELIPHFFYLLHKKMPYVAVTKNDSLIHYSSESISKYLNKIVWRVKNNIHHRDSLGMAGYTGRKKYGSNTNHRGLLFIPYAYSLVFPLYDSLLLMYTRKDFGYFLHVFLTLFTATIILYNYLLKMMYIKPKLKSYDETKEISQ
ncbi:MAG: glycosyltransferase family 2 protein [Candidatus Thorarchaeota archaeon]